MHCNGLSVLGEHTGVPLTGNLKNSEYDVPLPKLSNSEATVLVRLSCSQPQIFSFSRRLHSWSATQSPEPQKEARNKILSNYIKEMNGLYLDGGMPWAPWLGGSSFCFAFVECPRVTGDRSGWCLSGST